MVLIAAAVVLTDIVVNVGSSLVSTTSTVGVDGPSPDPTTSLVGVVGSSPDPTTSTVGVDGPSPDPTTSFVGVVGSSPDPESTDVVDGDVLALVSVCVVDGNVGAVEAVSEGNPGDVLAIGFS